ncbi:MAG: DUF362 domain-containing protein [Candidatus Tritonobacter lacicola]|nr:DUF362 domain-containing protein [Candidatus Tritonobacter lacicola]
MKQRETVDRPAPMDRRTFVKLLGLGSLLATSAGLLGTARGSEPASKKALVSVVKGDDPSGMVRRLLEPLGGMARFVKKGARVVIKPNAAWERTPQQAANTNPRLVAEVIRLCYEAGAGKVLVVENPCDRYEGAFKISGIEEASRKAGVRMKPMVEKGDFIDVKIEKGVVLKEASVGRVILDADVLINMPVAKTHGSAVLTMAMKNHMGTVFDRWAMHKAGLHQAIADLASFVRPTLNIMDALQIMTDRGPKGPGPLLRKDIVAASTDQVALDAFGATLFGMTWKDIPYIVKAQELGVGVADPKHIEVIEERLAA